MNRPNDCLQAMFMELRATIPPLPALISDCDSRTAWLANLAQVLQAMPTEEQQWACLVQVSNDLCTTRYPALHLHMAYDWFAQQCGLSHVLAIVQAQHLTDALEEGQV